MGGNPQLSNFFVCYDLFSAKLHYENNILHYVNNNRESHDREKEKKVKLWNLSHGEINDNN